MGTGSKTNLTPISRRSFLAGRAGRRHRAPTAGARAHRPRPRWVPRAGRADGRAAAFKREMREGVLEGRIASAGGNLGLGDFGKQPEAAPDSGRRTLRRQYFAVGDRHQHRGAPGVCAPPLFLRPGARHALFRGRNADQRHRAAFATGIAREKGVPPGPSRLACRQACREPEGAFSGRRAARAARRLRRDRHRCPHAARSRFHVASRNLADALAKAAMAAGVLGPRPAGLPAPRSEPGNDDLARSAMQVSTARVVTGRSRGRARPPRWRRQAWPHPETAPRSARIGDDRGDLGLLQHGYFREPAAVGVGRALPGQVVAAVAALPAHDARGESHGSGVGGSR